MRMIATLVAAALLIIGASAYAGDKEAESKPKQASFEGKLVCLGCDLKKTEGARAACSVYGHDHVLKTKDSTYISFLENDYSKDLISGEKYHDKEIQVTGVYHDRANMLDVETFTVDGKKMGWCDHCKAMDHCPFSGKSEM